MKTTPIKMIIGEEPSLDRFDLNDSIQNMESKIKQVMILRYGLDGFGRRSQREVSESIDRCVAMVAQYERRGKRIIFRDYIKHKYGYK